MLSEAEGAEGPSGGCPPFDHESLRVDVRAIVEAALKPCLADLSGTLCADVRAEMRRVLKEVQAEDRPSTATAWQGSPVTPRGLVAEPKLVRANSHEWISRHIRGYGMNFLDGDDDDDDNSDDDVHPSPELRAPAPVSPQRRELQTVPTTTPVEAWNAGVSQGSPRGSPRGDAAKQQGNLEDNEDLPHHFRIKSLPRLLHKNDHSHRRFRGKANARGALWYFRLTYGLRKTVMPFVKSQYFDYIMFFLITVNAVSIGAQTNHLATNSGDEVPLALRMGELFFAVIFTAEMLLRLFVYGFSLFQRSGWEWNVFDCMVVGLQLVELIFTEVPNLSFLRVVRVLRLVRVIRLIRILRHISELRTLVASIGLSLKSLGWTAVLLLVMIYMVSLMITEVVSAQYSDMEEGEEISEHAQNLRVYFGSLGRSMLSMFQAISGGLDWDTLVAPLISEISDWHAMIFVLYVAFAQLAMMNVVTGVFVESVLTSAQKDRDLFMINNVRELFQETDGGIAGVMDWEVFQSKLGTRQMQEFFKAINVDSCEAPGLFRLLDIDSSGEVNAEEFLSGCLRLRGPAKALDLALLVREIGQMENRMKGLG